MSKLTSTFSTEASTASTEALLGASLFLMGADTRRGMDVRTQQALVTVAAQAAGHPDRTAYLSHYKQAAGGGHGGAPKAKPLHL